MCCLLGITDPHLYIIDIKESEMIIEAFLQWSVQNRRYLRGRYHGTFMLIDFLEALSITLESRDRLFVLP